MKERDTLYTRKEAGNLVVRLFFEKSEKGGKKVLTNRGAAWYSNQAVAAVSTAAERK